MNILTDISEWRKIRAKYFDKTFGFIPTMGNLHQGHLSLCERSKKENDFTVVSIYVNAPQFNQAEDFENYPRTLAQDKDVLEEHKIDYLLVPETQGMYPDNYEIQVTEANLSSELEGEFRPGHFNGMLTIVLKFLNLVQPTRSYFGEKDYQQLLLVKKMAEALFLQTEIIGCETTRADDGLALSSRNSRLTPEQRNKSRKFPELLQSSLSVDVIKHELEKLAFKVDYIADKWQRRLGAVWLDNIRLIDNIKK